MSSPRCQKYSFEWRKQNFLHSESLHSGKADKLSTQHLSQHEHKIFLHVPGVSDYGTNTSWQAYYCAMFEPQLGRLDEWVWVIWGERIYLQDSLFTGDPGRTVGQSASRDPLGTTSRKCSRVWWKFYEPFVTQLQGQTASPHTPLAGGVKSPSDLVNNSKERVSKNLWLFLKSTHSDGAKTIIYGAGLQT